MNDNMTYYKKLIEYSSAMTIECTRDSDQAVASISSVIELLLKDSERIRKISNDTLEAIEALEGVVGNVSALRGQESCQDLIRALAGLIKQNRSINDVVMPIIEALQFQDFIRQQMENMIKVMKIWHFEREKCLTSGRSPDLKEIGETMLKATTMQSEREIIRKHIAGLGEEQQVDSVMLF